MSDFMDAMAVRDAFTASPSFFAVAYCSRSVFLFASTAPRAACARLKCSNAAFRSAKRRRGGRFGSDDASGVDGFAGAPEILLSSGSSPVPRRTSPSVETRGASKLGSDAFFSSIATSALISSSRRRTTSASRATSAASLVRSTSSFVHAVSFSYTRDLPPLARAAFTSSRNTPSAARILSIEPPRSGSAASSSPQNRSTSPRSLASSLSDSASRPPSASPRASLSSSRSALFSSRSRLMTSLGSVSSFTSSALRTEAMRSAKRQVEMLSNTCSNSGLTVATIAVAQFPPSESFRSMVITLSR